MACRHSGRHVYVALGCVFDYATIACALRWGVALVGDYHYWALLTPSWDPSFRYRLGVHCSPAFGTAHRRKPDCGFNIYFVNIYGLYLFV